MLRAEIPVPDALPTAELRQKFLEGMRRVAHTVSVVTTDGPAGRAGATVSAMTSVSVDSALPTLLVCLNAASHTASAVLANGHFAVNILAVDQTEISNVFAGRGGVAHAERFDGLDVRTGVTGSPVLGQALTTFECRLVSESLVGTHHVIFGEVVDMHFTPDRPALVYLNRTYGRFEPL